MYGEIITSGAMDPDYLLHKARWWEVRSAISAHERSERPNWERSRWIVANVIAALGCKNKDTKEPLSLRDIMVFPWERESRAERIRKQEEEASRAEELRRSCIEYNKMIEQKSNANT